MAQRSRILAPAETWKSRAQNEKKCLDRQSTAANVTSVATLATVEFITSDDCVSCFVAVPPPAQFYCIIIISDYVHTNKLEIKNSKGCNRSTSNSSISLTFTNISSAFAQVLSVHNRDLQLTLSVNLTYCSRSLNAFQRRSSERIVVN